MTATLTEGQKTEELVKLAREQIDAFSKGDWELLLRNPRLRRPLRGVWNRTQGRGPGKDR